MTFTICYYRRDPLFDAGAHNPMGKFTRHQLREALACLRFMVRTCRWTDVTWILKRGRKTIARIPK